MTRPRNRDPKSYPFALWLCPDKEGERALKPMMHSLADRTGGVVFPPHITIASGTCGDLAILAEHDLGKTSGILPIKLRLREFGCGDDFFQSVFLLFEEHEGLERLHRFWCGVFDKAPDWMPHLSLTYWQTILAKKQRVAENLSQPCRDLVFDRLEFWAPRPEDSWRDIAGWHRVVPKVIGT